MNIIICFIILFQGYIFLKSIAGKKIVIKKKSIRIATTTDTASPKFVFISPGNSDTCGGCKVIETLSSILVSRGYDSSIHYTNYKAEDFNIANEIVPENSVVITPEECPPDTFPGSKLTVRWMLAPTKNAIDLVTVSGYNPNDLIFSYGLEMRIPLSNILMVLADPQKGDRFDVRNYGNYTHNGVKRRTSTGRQNIAFMIRKGHEYYHSSDLNASIGYHRSQNHTEINRALTMSQHIEIFLTHDYFYSYDPQSFYNFIAPMLNCPTILHPVPNMTKSHWILSTFLGFYFRTHNISHMPGIAYSNSFDIKSKEISDAIRTMSHVRHLMTKIKEMAENVTVPRFVRDVERALNGDYDNFESALTAKTFVEKYAIPFVKMKQENNVKLSRK